jgi:TPR repeat protein
MRCAVKGWRSPFKAAFAWLLESAKGGYLEAQREVSDMYMLGEGTPQSIA